MTLTDETAGYNVRAYETAGWYRHNVQPIIGTTERENRDGGHAGTFHTPTLRAPAATVEERRDIIRTLRNALADDDGRVSASGHCKPIERPWEPGVFDLLPVNGAVALKRAVTTLRGMRTHPADVAARAAVAMIPSDGTIPSSAPLTDGWETRQHDTVAKRTRKGRTTVERKRVGIAPVRGDVEAMAWSGHDDGMSDRASLARMLATAELRAEHVTDDRGHTVYGARRLRSGARVGFDVQRVTDRHYASLGLPALLGTDVTSWEEIVTVPNGVDPARCRVAVGRSYLGDAVPADVATDIAGDRAEYASHTRKAIVFPARRTLKLGRKRTNDPREVTFYRGASPADGVRTLYGYWQRVTLLLAPAATVDHRYRGHTLVLRPAVTDRRGHRRTSARRAAERRATLEREARTIGPPITRPDTIIGTAELLTNLNRGERVMMRAPGITQAVTRSTAGLYATQYTRTSGKRATYRTRSAQAMATFLHSLTV